MKESISNEKATGIKTEELQNYSSLIWQIEALRVSFEELRVAFSEIVPPDKPIVVLTADTAKLSIPELQKMSEIAKKVTGYECIIASRAE